MRGKEAPLWRRLLAFLIDHGLILFASIGLITLPYALLGGTDSIGIAVGMIAYCVGQFAYQYHSVFTGRPTIGQTVLGFVVEAKAKKADLGMIQHALGMASLSPLNSSTAFLPTTIHMLGAAITLPAWPIVIIEAMLNSERRFWWARVSGTATVMMRD